MMSLFDSLVQPAESAEMADLPNPNTQPRGEDAVKIEHPKCVNRTRLHIKPLLSPGPPQGTLTPGPELQGTNWRYSVRYWRYSSTVPGQGIARYSPHSRSLSATSRAWVWRQNTEDAGQVVRTVEAGHCVSCRQAGGS